MMEHKQRIRRFLLPLAVLMLLLGVLLLSRTATFAQGEQDRWAGTVSNESGAPLTATVTINGVEAQASTDGSFELLVPRAEDSRYVINAESSGYVPVSQIHVGNAIEALNLTLKQASLFDVDPSQAVEVQDERGTQISLPANSLVDANGNPATSPLQLQVYTYDLTQEEMPGDMSALDSDGQPVALESAGVFFAEFSDASGNKYNLAPNTQAEISIPVDESAQWPDVIPLWSYDESRGLWIEEGQASRVGDRFVGGVAHFSIWNFDIKWGNPACIKLTVDAQYLFEQMQNQNPPNSGIKVRAVVQSPHRVRDLTIVQTTNALYNLPANAKVNFYMPPSSPTPFASVNTGAPWGQTGSPPHPYDRCNGTLHIGGSQITEVTPRYGLNSGPSTMYIYGKDFSEPLTVTLGPTQTLEVDFVRLNEDPQRIRAVVPQTVTIGVYDVTVESESGRASLPDAYEVLDAVTTDDLLSSGDWMWTDPMPMRVDYANSGLGLNVQHLGGTRTVDTITVTFRLDSPSGPLLGHGYTSPLPPDSTKPTGKVTWLPQEPSEPYDDPLDYTVCAIIDPDNEVEETNENNNVICREITVLPPVCLRSDPRPGCPKDSEPPEVEVFAIQDDALSTVDTSVTLDVTASDYGTPASGVNAIKYIEFEYIFGARRWVPIQGQQTWIDYETANLDYPWELIETYGMRYMQAWAADGNRNISFDRERLISLGAGADVIDLVPTVQEDTVRRDDVVFYRILLEEGDSLSATMTPINGGNPDMYVWGSNQSQPWYDPEPDAGTGVEQVQFSAPVKGTYQIEIHGPSNGRANYRLEFGATHLTQQVQPNGLNREPRQVPEDPAVPLDDWPEFYDVGLPPEGPGPDVPQETQLFLPLVIR
ncbi:MAG: pre-peptidase C-terminal domain-containing protein [Ardenticatenaceae bacterium]